MIKEDKKITKRALVAYSTQSVPPQNIVDANITKKVIEFAKEEGIDKYECICPTILRSKKEITSSILANAGWSIVYSIIEENEIIQYDFTFTHWVDE